MSDEGKLKLLTFPAKPAPAKAAPGDSREEVFAEAADWIKEYGCKGLMVVGQDRVNDLIFLSDSLPIERAVLLLERAKAYLLSVLEEPDLIDPE